MTTSVRGRISMTCRVAGFTLGGILLLVVIAVIVFLNFDWNRARPWVDDKVSAAIGRPFAIEGDLKLGWRDPVGLSGWRAWIPWPRFSARKITIGNLDWAQHPFFATLDEIDFQVEVLPLITRRIVIPSINLVNPSIDLERRVDGTNNWSFRLPSSSSPSEWKLDLHTIAFQKGHIALDDAQNALTLEATVDTLAQPIPIGAVLAEQEAASHRHAAEAVGASGAAKLSRQRSAASTSAPAAPAASAASAAAASMAARAQGPAPQPGSPGASGTRGAPALTSSAASGTPRPAEANPAATHDTAPGQSRYALGWTVKGQYKKSAVDGSGKLGGILALQDGSQPYPIQVDLRIGDARVALVGTLSDPAHLAALDLRLWLQARSMARLYDITGVVLPETPPFATDGRLVARLAGGPSLFRYENFTGRVGGSDLGGTLVYEDRTPRPMLSGTLVSNLLRFADLGPLIGGDSIESRRQRGDASSQPAGKVLPVEEFRTDRWQTLDADVRLTGRRILRDKALPISDLYTHLRLDNGVLTLDPLRLGVAGGVLTGTIHLDGSADPLAGRFSIAARHLRLKQLFPTFAPMQTSLGEINGDAALSALGNSPARLAATSNGEIKLLVNDGAISNLLLEAAGLNVANVVYNQLFGDKTTRIHCAAADLVVSNGVAVPRLFALDTDDALINVDGKVDLREETLDLTVRPHTKGFRVLSLRSPLYVDGTFAKPKVGIDIPAVALRGGAAIGLALINPFAALLPLLAPSNVKDSPCSEMFASMRALPSAPPPGVTQAPAKNAASR